MIQIYAQLIITDVKSLENILHKILPQNDISLIEQKTVLLSNGDTFECSIEPLLTINNGFYISGEFKNSLVEFNLFLSKLIKEFQLNNILYNIDYEIEEENKYTEYNTRDSRWAEIL